MGKFSRNTDRYSREKKPQAGVTAALALLVVVLAAVLAGLLLRGSLPAGEAAADTPAIPSVPPETAATQVPERVSFQPAANGNSTSVLCRASYTGSNAAADTVGPFPKTARCDCCCDCCSAIIFLITSAMTS